MMRYAGEIITLKRNGKVVRVKQVNKTSARKHYDEGKTIYLLACNMRVNNQWQGLCLVNKSDVPEAFMQSFDSVVNDFKYYNCDLERGTYPIFFIEVD